MLNYPKILQIAAAFDRGVLVSQLANSDPFLTAQGHASLALYATRSYGFTAPVIDDTNPETRTFRHPVLLEEGQHERSG